MPFVKYKRIDHYWHKILSITDNHGEAKYASLSVVVRLALSLSHGQADVERGFSVNKHVLNDRTVMNEATLHGLRTVKKTAKHESIFHIPITKGLLIAYRKAYRAYKEALDAINKLHKQEASLSKRKEQLEDLKNQLNVKKQKIEKKQQQTEKLLKREQIDCQ